MSVSYESKFAEQRFRNRSFDKSWFIRAAALLERNGLLADRSVRCIDFGCSACEFVELLRKHYGVESIAADFPPNAVEFARQLGFRSFRFDGNDPESLPAEYTGWADYASCLGTIEHITDLDSMFALVRRALKDDGLFVFTTPNSAGYKSYFNYLYEGTVEFEGHHYRFFNKPRLMRLVVLNGFELVDEFHEEIDNWRVALAEKLVNGGLRLLKPLFVRLVWARCFDYGRVYYHPLRILDWGMLVRKDPQFHPLGSSPDLIDPGPLSREKLEYLLDKIDSRLVVPGYLGPGEFKRLRGVLESRKEQSR